MSGTKIHEMSVPFILVLNRSVRVGIGASCESFVDTETVEMAHKKGQGSTRNGRDSKAQRRGVKKFGGEAVIPGAILVRQVGTKFLPGRNVGMGKDYTIFSLVEGQVYFDRSGKRINVAIAEAS